MNKYLQNKIVIFFILLLVSIIPNIYAFVSLEVISSNVMMMDNQEEIIVISMALDKPINGSMMITHNPNIIPELQEFDYVDNNFVINNGNYKYLKSLKSSKKNPGSYSITVSAKDAQNNTIAITTKNGVIIAVEPSIIYTSPNGIIKTNNIFLEADTVEDALCKYDYIDGSYDNFRYFFSNTGKKNHTSILSSLEDKEYQYYVRCKDNFGNKNNASSIIHFFINSPPLASIQIGKPSSTGVILDKKVVLNVTTNENSSCKYDTIDIEYGKMLYYFDGFGNKHSLTLNLNEGSHTYYVRCKDEDNNIMGYSETINFIIDLPPTAQIRLNKKSPLIAGIVEVKLIASEDLQNSPTLKYFFSDSPESNNLIPLKGAGKEWEGYIIINDYEKGRVGSFVFSGRDLYGNMGNEIIDGKLFIVDTIKPPQVSSVKATALKNGMIKIKWYYEGEEYAHFNVYRSTSEDIDQTELYDTANNDSYIDSSTIDKMTYYYKISAVDKAGNEGLLSKVVYSTAVEDSIKEESIIKEDEKTQEVKKVLPPNLVVKVGDLQKRLENLMIDIEVAIKRIADVSDSDKTKLLAELKIRESLDNIKKDLENKKAEFDKIRQEYHSEKELDEILNKHELDLKKIKSTAIIDVSLVERNQYIQSIDIADITKVARYITDSAGLSDKEKESYVQENAKFQDKIKVETTLKVINSIFLEQRSKEQSIIEKRVSHEFIDPLQDVIVFENIDKRLAENANNIIINFDKYTVVEQDPIIKLGFLELDNKGNSFSYMVDGKVNFEDVKASKTIVLLSLKQLEKLDVGITGYLVYKTGLNNISKFGKVFISSSLFIILLSLLYYMLFVKYNITTKKFRKTKSSKQDMDFKIGSNLDGRFKEYDIMGKYMPVEKGEQKRDVNSIISEIEYDNMIKTLKDMKIDTSYKLYPIIVATMRNIENSKINGAFRFNDEDNFNLLLIKSYHYLENKNYENLKETYKQLRNAYKMLSKEKRSEVFNLCQELHWHIQNLT